MLALARYGAGLAEEARVGDSMKRMTKPVAVLATLLAVLMPLEQAHCAWMSIERNAAKVGGSCTASNHNCCAAGHPRSAKQAAAPATCACAQVPLGTLPVDAAGTHLVSFDCFASLPSTPSVVRMASNAAPPLAPDIGSPPLLFDLGAHGLRAPPVSA